MKIVLISDTHNMHDNYTIPECDILLHTGDFCMRGTIQGVRRFAKWFGSQPAKHKICIAGNHDFYCEFNPEESREMFRESGATILFSESVVVEGLKIYGSPWTPWFMDWAFNFPYDDDGSHAQKHWARIDNDTDILLTHGPPYGILDLVTNAYDRDPHVGCHHLLEKIMTLPQLKVSAFGHIHEARGSRELDGKLFINASSTDLHYGEQLDPIVINLEAK